MNVPGARGRGGSDGPLFSTLSDVICTALCNDAKIKNNEVPNFTCYNALVSKRLSAATHVLTTKECIVEVETPLSS